MAAAGGSEASGKKHPGRTTGDKCPQIRKVSIRQGKEVNVSQAEKAGSRIIYE